MPPLRDLITDPALDLTPSERKVVRALLDQYPRNGLGPMARLAEHAGVSDPTIVRLVKNSVLAVTPNSRTPSSATWTTACAHRARCCNRVRT